MRLSRLAFACAGALLSFTQNAPAQEFTKSATADGGMVAAAQPRAVEAGLEILEKGGNAADAAAAVAFAIAVVEPFGSSIGGDGVALVYMNENKELSSFTYRCQAPSTATRDIYDYSNRDSWVKTAKGPAIPGMVKGTLAMQEEFGKLTRQEIMAPSIRLARDGFTVERTLGAIISDMYGDISENEETASIFLDDLFPPDVGSTLKNPDLANSLTLISQEGESAFYQGQLARTITSYIQENGGYLTYEDFANYKATKSEPISIQYKDYQVVSVPPPFGGLAVLEMLQLYERVDTSTFASSHSIQNIHALAEIMTLAMKDRYTISGDPRFVDVPVDWVTSEEYADIRIKEYNPSKANVPREVDEGPVYKNEIGRASCRERV